MVPRSRGNTCAAILHTEPVGSVCAIGPSRPYGGCRVVDDPDLDARQANPLWSTCTNALLHLRATGEQDAPVAKTFSTWRIPGRKRISHAGNELVITTGNWPYRLRASLSTELEDGDACCVVVPIDVPLHARQPAYQMQARVIRGEVARPTSRPATRAALLHLRALQALDATQAGARHRDIAGVLFGADAVHLRWTADSELRAQVRHLINRAEGLMRGGYLALAGVCQQTTHTPGDEPER